MGLSTPNPVIDYLNNMIVNYMPLKISKSSGTPLCQKVEHITSVDVEKESNRSIDPRQTVGSVGHFPYLQCKSHL